MWAPFPKRLSEARIGLLTSAGLYVKGSQPGFDVERERANPEWGDPGWRLIPAGVEPTDIAVAHLHISDEDLLADPEIALPARLLDQLVEERVVGGATAEHMSVMGYQERSLAGWRDTRGTADGRAHPRPGLTRLLLERARAGTMDRKSGNLHGRGDDDAVGG
ncbi:MAG: hypothetical protein E6J37_09950 [Chloroflexi bacterium]|nr:MAG: hypothetical protein E6J37_09950 [Chloroflexota bacterium]